MDRDAVRSTMDDLVLNIHQKRERQSRDARTTSTSPSSLSPSDSCAEVFPDALLLSISTLQSSSNEFLRQFWSNYLPSPTALPPVPPATITTIAASRQVKVDKMLSYLEKVEEKVKGVLEDGVSEGVERSRIEAVCPPFLVLDGMLIEVGVTSREKGSRKSAQSVPRTSLAPCLHSILPLPSPCRTRNQL